MLYTSTALLAMVSFLPTPGLASQRRHSVVVNMPNAGDNEITPDLPEDDSSEQARLLQAFQDFQGIEKGDTRMALLRDEEALELLSEYCDGDDSSEQDRLLQAFRDFQRIAKGDTRMALFRDKEALERDGDEIISKALSLGRSTTAKMRDVFFKISKHSERTTVMRYATWKEALKALGMEVEKIVKYVQLMNKEGTKPVREKGVWEVMVALILAKIAKDNPDLYAKLTAGDEEQSILDAVRTVMNDNQLMCDIEEFAAAVGRAVEEAMAKWRTERRRLVDVELEDSSANSCSVSLDWMETIMCSESFSSGGTCCYGLSSCLDVCVMGVSETTVSVSVSDILMVSESWRSRYEIRHNTALGRTRNKAGFQTMWKHAGKYMKKIKKPEGWLYGSPEECEITDKIAGKIIDDIYKKYTRKKVELSQLEQVRHYLSYAYCLREAKPRGNFPTVNAKWKQFDLSELPAGMDRRRLARKTPTYGSERYNRLLQRLQGHHLAGM